jgi:two-component system response regulator MprA
MTPFTLERAYERIHHLRPVLVVEDDADILSSLAEVLRDGGYDVTTAANGYQALVQVKEHDPDLIILDLMLPRMNGWRFVQELRAGARRATPIVLLSAVENLPEEAARLGVQGFLRKPFELEELLDAARAWCRELEPEVAP